VPQEILANLAGKAAEEVLALGVETAARLVKRLKEEKLADGVYLKAKGRADLLAQILKAAGI
jgi:hypothetical protein